MGKTALALRLGQELRGLYPDAQIDIDLRGVDPQPLAPEAVMAEVIRAFDPTGRLPEGLEALGKVYRSVLDGKRVLLFFDNARDRAQIEPLLPPRGSLLLVTSRHHFTLPGIYTRRLDTLAEADAVALAQSIAPRLDAGTAGELAKVCGYLPLALRAAASVLAERVDMKPARYLDRLRGAERVKLIEEVLASSLELLAEPARAFWLRLGIMPADFDAPAAAAVGGLSSGEVEDHLGELVRRSLLEWDAAAERYRLHDLARSYAWARLDAAERDTTERRHAEHFVEVARSAENRYLEGGAGVAEGLRAFDREWPHIAAAQQWASAHAKGDDIAARACCTLTLGSSHLLPLRQHPRERIRWLEAALAASRQLNNRSAEGAVLGNFGIACSDLGEPRKAIELYEQHLAIAREIGDRRSEGNTLGNLGLVYKNLGEPRKAIELYEQHLAIAREIGDRRSEGSALGNLGNAYKNLGESPKAIELYEQHLVIAREIGDRRGEGNTLGNLGSAYWDLGEPRKAIELYEQHLVIAREIGDRRGEGNTLGNLGSAYSKLGETRKAIELFEQRLGIARESGDRRGEGNALGNLGSAYSTLGETHKAIELYEQSLVIAREIGDRRGEGNALGSLGVAYKNLGETRKAIELYEQRLGIAREVGDRRGESITSWNLGVAYEKLDDLQRAVDLMQVLVELEREIGHRYLEQHEAHVARLRARLKS